MKKILLVLLATVLLSGCGCAKSEKTNNQDNKNPGTSDTVNTNSGVTKTQIVDGITLSEPALISSSNSSTFTVKAENKTKNDIELKYFKIYLKDLNGKSLLIEPNYMIAPVYDSIKAGESKTLTAKIDKNLDSAYTIEYEMVK